MNSETKRAIVTIVIIIFLLGGWIAYGSYCEKYGQTIGKEVSERKIMSGKGLKTFIDSRVKEWVEERLVRIEMEKMDILAPLPNEEKIQAIEEVEKEISEYVTVEQPMVGGDGTPQSFAGMSVEDVELEMDLLHAKKMAWIFDQLEERMRRTDMVDRINSYLHSRGSPMAGLGDTFFSEAAKYGIDPRLGVAIAEAESTCGRACFAPHNAWGMLGYPSGWSSWEEGIAAHFAYLNRHFGSPQSAYDCPGYCEPNHPWMENVDGVRQRI
jgi:hypothetical protein